MAQSQKDYPDKRIVNGADALIDDAVNEAFRLAKHGTHQWERERGIEVPDDCSPVQAVSQAIQSVIDRRKRIKNLYRVPARQAKMEQQVLHQVRELEGRLN